VLVPLARTDCGAHWVAQGVRTQARPARSAAPASLADGTRAIGARAGVQARPRDGGRLLGEEPRHARAFQGARRKDPRLWILSLQGGNDLFSAGVGAGVVHSLAGLDANTKQYLGAPWELGTMLNAVPFARSAAAWQRAGASARATFTRATLPRLPRMGFAAQ
jgi:hypothetical protein